MASSPVITRKIGAHRGGRRIWIEGALLQAAGFTPGAKYQISADEASKTLTLAVCPDGQRVVSKKMKGSEQIPVIDICSASLLAGFAEVGEVEIQSSAGMLVIKRFWRTPEASLAK